MIWAQWIGLLSGSLAVLLNLLLLPVILYFSSEKLGVYKYCLAMYTVTGAAQCFFTVATLATWYAPPNGYLFYVSVPIYPLWLQYFCLYGCIAAFSSNLLSVCWGYLTRLSFLNGSDLFERPLKPLVNLLGCFVLSAWLLLLVLVTLIDRTDENALMFFETVWKVSETNLLQAAFIGGPVMINGRISWRLAVSVGSFMSFTLGASLCIFVCWCKIGQKLRKMQRLQEGSEANLRVQQRLYILLSIQALLPLVFNTAPACLAFVVGLTQAPLDDVIIFCGSILPIAQILDPFFTIILISDYRKGILKDQQSTPGQQYQTAS